MYFFRRPVDGGWKELKLGAEEVKTILDAAVDLRIKVFVKVKERMKALAEKNKIQFSEAEVLAVYAGVEDTYDDKAIDYISDMLAKKKEQQAATK